MCLPGELTASCNDSRKFLSVDKVGTYDYVYTQYMIMYGPIFEKGRKHERGMNARSDSDSPSLSGVDCASKFRSDRARRGRPGRGPREGEVRAGRTPAGCGWKLRQKFSDRQNLAKFGKHLGHRFRRQLRNQRVASRLCSRTNFKNSIPHFFHGSGDGSAERPARD